MDYIKASEDILKKYNRLVDSLDTLQAREDRLIRLSGPSDKVVATLDLSGITDTGSSKKDTMQVIAELRDIKSTRQATKEEIGIIDQTLDIIAAGKGNKWRKDILIDWYIEQLPRESIRSKYYTSKRNIYNLRQKALEDFAEQYFGLPAIKQIYKGANK